MADTNVDRLVANEVDVAGDAVIATGTPVAHIADPAGGGTQDAQARTAIASILNALEEFGIVLPS